MFNSIAVFKGEIESLKCKALPLVLDKFDACKDEHETNQVLVQCALHPCLTSYILRIFRPIAIDIFSRALQDDIMSSTDWQEINAECIQATLKTDWIYEKATAEKQLNASNILLQTRAMSIVYHCLPQISTICTEFMTRHSIDLQKMLSNSNEYLLPSILRLLLTDPHVFKQFFEWTDFSIFLELSTAFYAANIIAILMGLSDCNRRRFFNQRFPDQIAKINLLPWFEMHEIQREFNQMKLLSNASSDVKLLDDAILFNSTVKIENVLLVQKNRVIEPLFKFVLTESFKENLQKLALLLSMKVPILLQGDRGTGKTSLVEYLSAALGHDGLFKIHLGDQTDAKVLLGTYVSTDNPGVFKWQPGVLTLAATLGKWILVEDLDLASPEVISILVPLLENRKLYMASRGETIDAAQDFRIFATKSTKNQVSNGMNENLWSKIELKPLSMNEIRELLGDTELNDLMIQVYQFLTSKTDRKLLLRGITIRDLLKWASRCSNLPINIVEAKELLLREAIDCFLGFLDDFALKTRISLEIGQILNVPDYRVEYFMTFVPIITAENSELTVGRCRLPCNHSYLDQNSMFAMTSHASRLIESIAVCIKNAENVLLVGETGTGKTTAVQQLALMMNKKLEVINMSQQSDSSDLLGGFKPVDSLSVARSLMGVFDSLFPKTFSAKKNTAFIGSIHKTYTMRKWKQLVVGLNSAFEMALKLMGDSESPKRIKSEKKQLFKALWPEWKAFKVQIDAFALRIEGAEKIVFSFVEGTLIKAMRNGDWILLDEINLASPETLDSLSGLLQQGSNRNILLVERGDSEPIVAHPDFRLFGCMNPANDAEKHDLTPGIRSKFSEFWVESPDRDEKDLKMIVKQYLSRVLPPGIEGERLVQDICYFYLEAKNLCSTADSLLLDGAGKPVNFSIRTLSRSLKYVLAWSSTFGVSRACYEGLEMTFLTLLNNSSRQRLQEILQKHLLQQHVKNIPAFLSQIVAKPHHLSNSVLFGTFWLQCGDFQVFSKDQLSHYVITESVDLKLYDLARAIQSRYPILIQGPTSAGKTSMIEYLSQRTGNKFVRINNHEHTDIQEYIGSYVADSEGRLVFKEGVLVEALRKGYWIVLDELNLAPSDVLEALNRLLDDNRELFIAETQEIVKPHPNFMLFATQNPPGLYGGRKILSRAFRNRFLELHFDDLPHAELEVILEKRSLIPRSYAKKMVQSFLELRLARQSSRIFDGNHGFVTLRDLFRWGNRHSNGYQELAEDGYMILGERTRTLEDGLVVKQTLETVFKVKLDVREMYETRFNQLHQMHNCQDSLVWTDQMKRLYVLVEACIRFKEPILLVGETGCGKTSVCQVIASHMQQHLHILNAHQNTETADFLGSQRPLRSKENTLDELRKLLLGMENLVLQDDLVAQAEFLIDQVDKEQSAKLKSLISKANAIFEWCDGPLIQAMKQGDFFLIDEISLADDSVLERLNSVLEPARLLVLAEKAETSDGEFVAQEITAAETFQFMATMNPGGDHGKRELSPALRNRFTEIWVGPIQNRNDLNAIICKTLDSQIPQSISDEIIDFLEWIAVNNNSSRHQIFSIRDILAWASAINIFYKVFGIDGAFVHGGMMNVIDSIGANPNLAVFELDPKEWTRKSMMKLLENKAFALKDPKIEFNQEFLNISGFNLKCATEKQDCSDFAFSAPTTAQNLMRVVRAMHLSKPILLEGSPGVGKTSLIVNLARLTGNNLVRINLSEQTDLMDLFGSDLPVEDSHSFAWRDGPFLRAMANGDWVLLDELNLASQQVLEGLNACLDHRGQVYIPELDKSFEKSSNFRIFGAQNPVNQGGGRNGLPKSFLNRFTKVYLEELDFSDLKCIISSMHPDLDHLLIEKMVKFTFELHRNIVVERNYATEGSPWEFNLRDMLRWVQLMKNQPLLSIEEQVWIIYIVRIRSKADRNHVIGLFESIFDLKWQPFSKFLQLDRNSLKIGNASIERINSESVYSLINDNLEIRKWQLPYLSDLIVCVNEGWLSMLVGPSGCGKSSIIRLLSKLTGNKLSVFSVHASIDALELLGGFEQVDINRRIHSAKSAFNDFYNFCVQRLIFKLNFDQISQIESLKLNWKSVSENATVDNLIEFSAQLDELEDSTKYIAQLKQSIQDWTKCLEIQQQGRFEWIDSPLIDAIENGHWILLDNANTCPFSVLDRLNSLFETDGSLLMNERGIVNGEIKKIKPHKNFRMFMTMDNEKGDVSRAMRNRGIEIFIIPPNSIQNSHEQKMTIEMLSRGLPTDYKLDLPHWWTRGFLSRDYSIGIKAAVEYFELFDPMVFVDRVFDDAELRKYILKISNNEYASLLENEHFLKSKYKMIARIWLSLQLMFSNALKLRNRSVLDQSFLHSQNRIECDSEWISNIFPFIQRVLELIQTSQDFEGSLLMSRYLIILLDAICDAFNPILFRIASANFKRLLDYDLLPPESGSYLNLRRIMEPKVFKTESSLNTAIALLNFYSIPEKYDSLEVLGLFNLAKVDQLLTDQKSESLIQTLQSWEKELENIWLSCRDSKHLTDLLNMSEWRQAACSFEMFFDFKTLSSPSVVANSILFGKHNLVHILWERPIVLDDQLKIYGPLHLYISTEFAFAQRLVNPLEKLNLIEYPIMKTRAVDLSKRVLSSEREFHGELLKIAIETLESYFKAILELSNVDIFDPIVLERIQNSKIKSIAQSCIQCIQNASQLEPLEQMKQLGNALVMASILLNLVLKDSAAFDPVSEANLYINLEKEWQQQMIKYCNQCKKIRKLLLEPKDYLIPESKIEKVIQGSIENSKKLSVDSGYRPVGDLGSLNSKLEQFISRNIEFEMLIGLIDNFNIERHDLIQKQISDFISILRRDYSGFIDLIEPVISNLLVLKTGLKLISDSQQPFEQLNLSMLQLSTDLESTVYLISKFSDNTSLVETATGLMAELVDHSTKEANEQKQGSVTFTYKQDSEPLVSDHFDSIDKELENSEIPPESQSLKQGNLAKLQKMMVNSEADDEFLSKILQNQFNECPQIFYQQSPNLKMFIAWILKENYSESKSIDFSQGNPSKAIEILPVLLHLDQRVKDLLIEWPENFVLGKISDLVALIAKFPVSTSLLKYLNALEMLLMTCHDWQTNASTKVSIQENMDEISGKIIEWRRLELDSWKLFIDKIEADFKDASDDLLWQELFKLLIEPCQKVHPIEYFNIVISAINDAMASSSLGNFCSRLELLDQFRRHLLMLSKTETVQKLNSILYNYIQFYSLFKGSIISKQAEFRRNSSKLLQDLQKIASWKDVNVFHLKETSASSHNQINKILKQYKENLSSVFVNLEPQTTSLKPFTLSKIKLKNEFQGYSGRMVTLCSNLINSICKNCEDESLAKTIISTCDEFTKENDEIASKKTTGHKQRRKKSLLDLLEKLAEIGLGRTSFKFEKNDFMLLQPIKITDEISSRVNDYYYKCAKRMMDMALISSKDAFHPDVPKAHHSRLFSCIQHLFEINTSTRSGLNQLLDSKERCSKLRKLSYSAKDCYLFTSSSINLVVKSAKALVETADLASKQLKLAFDQHPDYYSMASRVLECLTFHNALFKSLSESCLNRVALVTTDEFKRIQQFQLQVTTKFTNLSEMPYFFINELVALLKPQIEAFNAAVEAIQKFEPVECSVKPDFLTSFQSIYKQFSIDEFKIYCIDWSCLNRLNKNQSIVEHNLEAATSVDLEMMDAMLKALEGIEWVVKFILKEQFKLLYILLNLYIFMHEKGLGLPQDYEEKEENLENGQGLSGGQGDQDAKETEDIDLEDGMEAENEQDQPDELSEEKDENTIDADDGMDQTETEDVEKEEEEKEQQNEEMDDEMGDLDKDDASVLDEKLWNEQDEIKDDEKEDGETDEKALETVAGESASEASDNDEPANEDEEADASEEEPTEEPSQEEEEEPTEETLKEADDLEDQKDEPTQEEEESVNDEEPTQEEEEITQEDEPLKEEEPSQDEVPSTNQGTGNDQMDSEKEEQDQMQLDDQATNQGINQQDQQDQPSAESNAQQSESADLKEQLRIWLSKLADEADDQHETREKPTEIVETDQDSKDFGIGKSKEIKENLENNVNDVEKNEQMELNADAIGESHQVEVKPEIEWNPEVQEPLDRQNLVLINRFQGETESMDLDSEYLNNTVRASNAASREQWSKYELETRDLSFSLCEKLSLVLAPTVANRYKGDYRTGKRLNMRKIIPYIASHFKKDKIWMRRTKAAKRDYQILLCIDDSKSMKDCGACEMAFSSLVLISKALRQLQAGQLGVVKFGSDTELVQDLASPWNSETGPSVISSFDFDQDSTDLLQLMTSSIKILEKARLSSRSSDLWQLQIIISDGLCDNHPQLRSLVSFAAQKRIMVVFVVIDTRKDSLSKMTSVSYESGQLVMKKYMDSFPFDYYILLRDIQGLPMVLAETIRQYISFAR